MDSLNNTSTRTEISFIDKWNATSQKTIDGRDQVHIRHITSDGRCLMEGNVSVQEFLQSDRYQELGTPQERLALLQRSTGRSSPQYTNYRPALPISRSLQSFTERINEPARVESRRSMFPGDNNVVAQKLRESHLSREQAATRVEVPSQSNASATLGESVRNWCKQHGWSPEQFCQFQEAMGGNATEMRNTLNGTPNWVPLDRIPSHIIVYYPTENTTRAVLGPAAAARHFAADIRSETEAFFPRARNRSR